MQFVILVVLVAAVYGRDLSDAGYYPAHPHGRYDRQHINSPHPEETVRRYEENDPNRGNYENNRPVDLNHNRQEVNYEYNRELLNNDRNGRRHRFPNTDRHTHDIIREMVINLGFERQGSKKQREENLNLPKQSFNINNEYSKKVDVIYNDSNSSHKQNLPSPKDDSDMVFRNDDEDEHDKRKPPVRPNNDNSYNNDATNIGIVSFVNNIDINNTNNNINGDKQIKTVLNNSNNVKIESNSDSISNKDQQPSSKTTIADKVTPKPFLKDPVVKLDTVSEDKWVWSDDSKPHTETTTTDMTTLAELDDRGAFEGDKCATGTARVQGKCVSTE